MPCTPEAVHLFQKAGVLFAPGKGGQCGRLWRHPRWRLQQNASRDSWSFAQDRKPSGRDHDQPFTRPCHETAEEYGAPGDYVLGANIGQAFVRVADAMRAMGVI